MAKYSIDSTTLTGIGDAIRAKEGSSGTIPVTEIASRIQAIETGKDVSSVTATAADVISGKVFVDSAGNPVTGTLVTQTFYRGSGEPSADLGNDYDLYFVMAGGGSDVNLISFTYTGVGGTTYNLTAEEGMTWSEWCVSGYNITAMYVNSNGKVYDEEGKYVISLSGSSEAVKGTDIIVSNGEYELG